MTPCAWCLRWSSSECMYPGSDQCRTERRLEDMAYAINRSYVARQEEPQ